MKVSDCMKEIRKAKDAIDTLEKYKDGKMSGIAEQHIKEIESVIYAYIEMIEQCDVR